MPNLNFLVFLNSYSDTNPSNNPSLSNFKWDREIQGLSVNNPQSLAFSLAPGETRTLFNGTRTLLQDGTTQYSTALVPLSTSTYTLSWVGGTAPNFRTPRSTGADATTQVTSTVNGPLVTFTAPSVTALAASFTGKVTGMTTNVTLTANTAGTAGNSISLTGDGTSELSLLITNWNTANPSNQLTLTSGDGTQIPASGAVIQLAGGINSATAFNLVSGGVVVGDFVTLGNAFNPVNQGTWQILAVTATSFTIANETGVAEGPILLGSSFATQVQIYSAAGVQIGDTLDISSGFSEVTQGTYKVTAVTANQLQFYSTDVLPQEGPIMTEVTIYSSAKQLVYAEADQNCTVQLNGSVDAQIKPFIINNSTQPGVFMNSSTIWSIVVTNNSIYTANMFVASAE